MSANRTDAALLAAAMRAAGVTSARQLAPLLGVKERGAQHWLAGERRLSGPARQLCRLLVDDPTIAERLRAD